MKPLICTALLAIIIITAGCESLEVMPGAKPKPSTPVTLPHTIATAEGPEWSVSVSPSRIMTASSATVKVVFTLKSGSLAPGGGIKVLFPKSLPVRGRGEFQISNSAAPNYLTVKSSNPAAPAEVTKIKTFDPRTPWDDDVKTSIVTVNIRGKGLVRGDSIEMVFGDNPPAGAIKTSIFAYRDEIGAVSDLDGSGVYKPVIPMPAIESVPGEAFSISLVLPSITAAGEKVTAKLVVLDKNSNIANSVTGFFAVSSSDDMAEFPRSVNIRPEDHGRVEFPVTFKTPGIRRLRVRGEDDPKDFQSNVVKVLESPPAERIYWGELHSHTKYSYDAIGQGLFEYARDAASLDFCAITDHTTTEGGVVSINPYEWEEIKRYVASSSVPGKFITILGYEYNAQVPTSHHNVFFDTDNEHISDMPLLSPYSTGDVRNLWRELDRKGIKYITIPHHTAKNLHKANPLSSAAVSFGPGFANSASRPLIEIYSFHGQSELYDPASAMKYEIFNPYGLSINGPHYAQDALALGERLGFIASSDNHFARASLNSHGIAAVYSPELSRKSLFDAMRKRRTYATTGERIIVDFAVAGAPMGSDITIGDRLPEVRAEVHAPGQLDYVEILRFTGGMKNGHPVFETVRRVDNPGASYQDVFVDAGFKGGPAIYYMRAKQKGLVANREIWAWSSPVWVNY